MAAQIYRMWFDVKENTDNTVARSFKRTEYIPLLEEAFLEYLFNQKLITEVEYIRSLVELAKLIKTEYS